MQDLKRHGVKLKELPLAQLLDGLQSRRGKREETHSALEMHPSATLMQNALEAFVAGKVCLQLNLFTLKWVLLISHHFQLLLSLALATSSEVLR